MPFPFPFPVIPGNDNVSFPFPKFGNEISIPVPVPKNWEWNFHSRSQKLGMQFVIPVPVPKVWEWVQPFPFPFPNVQKSFPLTPGLHCTMRTLYSRIYQYLKFPCILDSLDLYMTQGNNKTLCPNDTARINIKALKQ